MPRKKTVAKSDKPAKKVTKKTTKKAAAEKPAPKKKGGLGKVKEETLKALHELGGKVTRAQVGEVTGRTKGTKVRELTEMGLVKAEVPEEGKRGQRFSLTAEGRKVAAKL